MRRIIGARVLLPAILITGLFFLWFFGPSEVFGYSTGAPSGYSGSPADARTCATPGCHSGQPAQKQGWILSDVPPEGFLPGQTYTLTITATRQGVSKYGFQVSPVDSFNNYGGTFSIADPGNTQLGTGFRYATHTGAGNSGNGSRSWTVNWTAPSGYPLWPVTIYGAFVAGDTIGNDSVYHSRLRLLPKNMGLSEDEARTCMRRYQGSGSCQFWINQPGDVQISIYDTRGSLLWSTVRTGDENPVQIPSDIRGLTLILVRGEQGSCTQKCLL